MSIEAQLVTLLGIVALAGIVNIIMLRQSSSAIRVSVDENASRSASFPSLLEKLINEKLTPRAEVVGGRIEVSRAAAMVIEEAHRCPQVERRLISIHGAAALSVPDIEYELHGDTGEYGQHRSHQDYEGALEAAMSDGVRTRRYVSLFSVNEICGRSRRVQTEYEIWLKVQLGYLERNDNYLLIDSMRAPGWRSGLARIVSFGSVMEIVANGGASLIYRDPEAAALIRDYSRQEIMGGSYRVFGQGFEASADVSEFQRYCRDISGAIKAVLKDRGAAHL